MEKYIIIRAGVNAGKTTTCALLFEELRKRADFAKIYTYRFKELESLPTNNEGDHGDFIGIIIIKAIVIIIISQGDVAKDLKNILESIEDKSLIKQLTNGLADSITYIVCCARSMFKKNSTIDMLYNKVNEDLRKEFWTVKSENKNDRYSVKHPIVRNIIEDILK